MSDEQDTRPPPSPIAIIGLSCRLPGADDLDAYWELLKAQREAVGTVPEDRWDRDYFYHPDPGQAGKMYTRAGGFIANVDKFDADFFGIAPREAEQMDPQQRLALELTWEALESAGIVPANITGSDTSVVMGVSSVDYASLQRERGEASPYTMSGGAASLVSNRISYIFDLQGPSFAVDTACSSALVAVHAACETLRRGEASLAVAGGVNILLSPWSTVGFSRARMLSATGHCHAFDARADGYVRSEGGGVVILKPLAKALADGDPIKAVIRGSRVNSDGRTTGIAMPNATAQERLLREVYAAADLDPGRVAYVEAHGTGTSVGDPAECAALGAVIGAAHGDGRPCLIGSVKTNIGHLESAAGIAGLAKAVLILRHREIPASLHFETPNPATPFASLNLEVASSHRVLDRQPDPLVIGVNSFGFGGTNAHVVLEEHVPAPSRTARKASGLQTLLISARSPAALSDLAGRYAQLLRHSDASGEEVCRGAALARAHHSTRLATFGANAAEIADRLAAFVAGDAPATVLTGQTPGKPARLALVFSGNGSQWVGMGRDLAAREPLIARWLTRIDDCLRPLTGWSLRDVLIAEAPEDAYDRTEIAQPALFAVQVAVIEWLRAAGVVDAAAIGHSVGEVAACYAAGILSLEQACAVIAHRSALQGRTAGTGKMAAAAISAERAADIIARYGTDVTIAGVNSPTSVTLAGEEASLRAIGESLAADGVFYRILALDYAFHSKTMDPIRDDLLERLAGLRPGAAKSRFFSTVTGREQDGTGLGAPYWWDNIRKPVRFAEAIGNLVAEGFDLFLEIGPHPVLTGYVNECLRGTAGRGRAVGTLRRREPEAEALRMALGACYVAGAELELTRAFPGGRPSIDLPHYPWQRERFFLTRSARMPLPAQGPREHPLLGYRLPTSDAIWQNSPQLWLLSYLSDHVVQGAIVFPAAGYVEMALAAGALQSGGDPVAIEDFEIRKPVILGERTAPRLEFALAAEGNLFRITAGDDSQERPSLVATGRIVPLAGKEPPDPGISIEGLRRRMTGRIDGGAHYQACAAQGLAYGPAFRGVAETWSGHDEALGRIVLPEAAGSVAGYQLHPVLLDACLQVIFSALGSDLDPDDQASYLPAAFERIRFHGQSDGLAWCHVRVRQRTPRSIIADLTIRAEDRIIATAEGVKLRRVDQARAAGADTYHWLPRAKPRASLSPQSAMIPDLSSLAAAALKPHLDGGDAVASSVDQLAVAYAARAIERLRDGNDRIDLANAAPQGRQSPYLSALFAVLERQGILRRTASGLRFNHAVADPEPLWRRLVAEHPSHFAALELVARCGERLLTLVEGADIGLGASVPRDADLIEQLLESDPLSRRRNDTVANVVAQLEAQSPAGSPLRILEVSGGPASFAGMVLAPSRAAIEYALAAVDPAAVAAADARFAGLAGFRASIVDLERPLTDQGFVPEQFDLVIAGAMLPGRGGPRQALQNIRGTLKPKGLLIVVGAGDSAVMTLLFGLSLHDRSLLDGEDVAEPTPEAPAGWRALILEAGFEEAAIATAETTSNAFSSWAILARNSHRRAEPVALPQDTPRTWLIVQVAPAPARDPSEDAAVQLAKSLAASGHRPIILSRGGQFHELDANRFIGPLEDEQSYRSILEGLARDGGATKLQIVFLGMRGEKIGSEPGDPAEGRDDAYALTVLYRAIEQMAIMPRPELWLITAGAMTAPSRADPPDPSQAMLWGVARTMMNELPELGSSLIDLDPGDTIAARTTRILDELLLPDGEDEVVLSGSGRYVNRIERGLPQFAAKGLGAETDASPCRLVLGQTKGRDALSLQAIERPSPGPDEVLVRVMAGGLNFRDVLQRSGVLPVEAFEGGFAGATLGMEFAGEVVETGAAVTRCRRGDKVFGFAAAALGTHVVTKEFAVFAMPQAWRFAEAATLPVAMVTVIYALEHLARLQPGERVLIQGAAGGVGLAAIQYCQWVGAEIFATAGTAEKRAYLRRLGVQHLLDSRSVEFAAEIRRITAGEGVDVVLNSVSGEAIAKGISILRPFGRFVELGKRDFYANSKLGLQPFRNNIEFFGVDVDQLLLSRRNLAATLFERIGSLIESGVLRPLGHRVYPAAQAAEAFRYMQQSRQIGKVVIAFDAARPTVARAPAKRLMLPADATYLVTGGRGGFGLATAEWLAERGARHLVLVGRRAAAAPAAVAVLDRLRDRQVSVFEAALDVTDGEAVAGLFREIERNMPPLRGIIHSAGVIEDAAIANMSRERFDAVVRPKVLGAWHLHRLSRGRRLDFFVLYSSAVTLIGNPGQANYLAANLYLEALAGHRRAQGLPGLAMLWGAIAEVGHVARNPNLAKAMTDRLGVIPMPPRQALDGLEHALLADLPHLAVAELDWSKLSRLPRIVASPRYADVADQIGSLAERRGLTLPGMNEHLASLSLEEAAQVIAPMIARQVSEVMRIPAAKLDCDKPLIDLGMDSLMLVELQMQLEQQLAVTIPVLELMDMATIGRIALHLAEKIKRREAHESRGDEPLTDGLDIDAMAEDELDEVLSKLLEKKIDQQNPARVA